MDLNPYAAPPDVEEEPPSDESWGDRLAGRVSLLLGLFCGLVSLLVLIGLVAITFEVGG